MNELAYIEEWLGTERHLDVETKEEKIKSRLENILLGQELRKLNSEGTTRDLLDEGDDE